MPEPTIDRYRELLDQIYIIDNFLKYNLEKNPLIENREAAIDEFLGPDGQNVKEAIEAYFSTIKGVLPDGSAINQEFADEYIKMMESLITRAFGFSKYYSYSEAEIDKEIEDCIGEIEKNDDIDYKTEEKEDDKAELNEQRILRKKYLRISDYIVEKLAEVFKQDNIGNLSPEDMRVIDKQLMHIASYSKAMEYFTYFVEFEKKMKEANKPISSDVQKRYVQTFLGEKAKYENNGIEPPEAIKSILLQAENYYIDYACKKLAEFDKKYLKQKTKVR